MKIFITSIDIATGRKTTRWQALHAIPAFMVRRGVTLVGLAVLCHVSLPNNLANASTPDYGSFGTMQQDNIVVEGVTSDGEGSPLSGINVAVKGTHVAVTTDAQGRYSISVARDGVLVFSSVGFITQEVAVNGRRRIDVRLDVGNTALDEVVVTALGIERQARTLTYSTQNVKSKELSETREPNMILSLQGKVAGLSVTESDAGVGSPTRVVLRGNRSISGDSQPIYIVDGVLGSTNVNPDNIESITILKGANAAALYGSAAQNGAIVIETKRGKAGVTSINLTSNFIATQPFVLQKFQNVYGQGSGGAYNRRSEFSWGPKMEGQLVDHWSLAPEDQGTQYELLPQPDNIRDFYRYGLNLTNNVGVLYGNDNVQTAFSYNRVDARGILENDQLTRNGATLRVNSKLFNKLTLDSKIEYSTNDNPGEKGYSPNYSLYLIPRNIRPDHMAVFEYRNAEGELFQNYWLPNAGISRNPHWTRKRILSDNVSNSANVLLSLKYDIMEDLSFLARGNYSGGNGFMDRKIYVDTYNQETNGVYSETMNKTALWNGDFLATYKRDVLPDLSAIMNVGGQIVRSRGDVLSANTGPGLTVPNLFTLSNTTNVVANETISESETQSLYAFLNLAWKNAIFLDVTGRNDWSSTLPADNRSYFYPSVGLSAVISDLIKLPDAISYIKLRGAWAQVGSSADPYRLSRLTSIIPGGVNGFLVINPISPNPQLLPEITESVEAGLDIQLFGGKLNFDLTAYRTNTRNQLFTVNLPLGSGASQYYANGGEIRNDGFEVIAQVNPVKRTHFNWDMSVNFAANRSKVVAISDERPRVEVGQIVIEEGQPWGNIYARGFQRDGQGRVVVNSSGLPLLTPNQSEKVANFNPNWLGSISQTFRYKDFNLRFLIDHRQGGTLLSYTSALLHGYGVAEGTLLGREGGLVFGDNIFAHETAVLEDGAPNNIEVNAEQFWNHIAGISLFVGEPFVESATNTRLRELSLGYTVPASHLNNRFIKSMTVSLVGRNLFFLYRASKMVDADLRVGTGPGTEGIDQYIRPSSRTFGVNLSFGF